MSLSPWIRRHIPLLLFLGLFGSYALTAGAVSLDVRSANFAAWKAATTGETTFEADDWPELDSHPIRDIWIVDTGSDGEAIGRASGVIAASIPAYWLTQPDTFTDLPGELTAAALTAAGMVLLYQLLVRRLRPRDALTGTLILGLTTPVWTVAADGMWPHTLTVLGIVGMAWAADRERWLLLGLFGGVALWGRLHVAVICAILGISIALARRSPAIAVKVGVSSALMLAASCGWTRWFYGSWDPTSGYRVGDFGDYANDNRFDLLNHLGFWLAPDRGLLVWTPLLLVLTPALVTQWKTLPDWSRFLLLSGIAYLVLQGVMNRYSGGSAFFPYRLQLETLAAAAPALAFAAKGMSPTARRMFWDVVIVQGGVIFVAAFSPLLMSEVSADRNELLVQGVTLLALVVACMTAHTLARWAVKRETLVGSSDLASARGD